MALGQALKQTHAKRQIVDLSCRVMISVGLIVLHYAGIVLALTEFLRVIGPAKEMK